MSERPALTLRKDFYFAYFPFTYQQLYSRELQLFSFPRKEERVDIPTMAKRKAEAQLPSSLSLLERMYVFKCELGFYILGKELSITNKKFSGQDSLLW